MFLWAMIILYVKQDVQLFIWLALSLAQSRCDRKWKAAWRSLESRVCVFMMVINRRRATIQNRNKSRHLISISMEKLSSKFKQFASSSEVHHRQRWRSTPSPHLSIWSLWLGDFNCGPISICGTIEIGDVTPIDRSIVCHLSSGFCTPRNVVFWI